MLFFAVFQGEFLCPVCRGLVNSVLPALPAETKRSIPSLSTGPSDPVGLSTLRFQEALSLLQSAADVGGSREILQCLPLQHVGQMRVNLEYVVRVLCEMYFPEKDKIPTSKDKISESGRLSHSLILFDTLKYSLVSTEIASRSGSTSLAPNYSLDALFKELKSTNCFILTLLLSIVQSIRTKNSLTILLRLRGIQLFAESICSDISVDESPDNSTVGGIDPAPLVAFCASIFCKGFHLDSGNMDIVVIGVRGMLKQFMIVGVLCR